LRTTYKGEIFVLTSGLPDYVAAKGGRNHTTAGRGKLFPEWIRSEEVCATEEKAKKYLN